MREKIAEGYTRRPGLARRDDRAAHRPPRHAHPAQYVRQWPHQSRALMALRDRSGNVPRTRRQRYDPAASDASHHGRGVDGQRRIRTRPDHRTPPSPRPRRPPPRGLPPSRRRRHRQRAIQGPCGRTQGPARPARPRRTTRVETRPSQHRAARGADTSG